MHTRTTTTNLQVKITKSDMMCRVKPRPPIAPDSAFLKTVVDLAARVGCKLEPPTGETQVLRLRVGGMTCAACVSGVEKALTGVPGVLGARVALMSGTAAVDIDPYVTNPADLVEAVR